MKAVLSRISAATAVLAFVVTAVPLSGQEKAAAKYAAQRTADNHPDMQGAWARRGAPSLTPRPKEPGVLGADLRQPPGSGTGNRSGGPDTEHSPRRTRKCRYVRGQLWSRPSFGRDVRCAEVERRSADMALLSTALATRGHAGRH